MPKGGYRPGAGRKKGTKDKTPRKPSPAQEEAKKIKEMLAYDIKAKAKFYQEFLMRVSKGETLTTAEKKMMDKLSTELAAATQASEAQGKTSDVEADEFLRQVWNDPGVEISLRIRAAEIVFRGIGDGKFGKKDEQGARARAAGAGKFAAGKAPLKVVK